MIYLLRFLLIITPLYLGWSGGSTARAEVLKIAAIDWCPQVCPNDLRQGYVVDTVKEIFAGSPFELEINIYSWVHAIELTRSGKAHALLSPARSEAPGLLFPDEGVGTQKMCFFVSRESDWRYIGEDSLQNQRIGVISGGSIEELNDYMSKHQENFYINSYTAKYVPLSARMVEKKRLDSFIFTLNSTLYELKKAQLSERIKTAGCVSTAKIYMAFSPDATQGDLIQRAMALFDQRMSEMIAQGRITSIMGSYGLADWKSGDKTIF
ncbi:substrate-binding periplasmic protein [Kiloniella laminariae]|uniref:substrate-binding periplasmic protein n=1 Tax=Kiloniella laminariae TaxID=454162 RepID=UPI00036F1CE6|nr:transporter substrate-binding domain-containing protein [Kiloniella laminariae]